MRGVMRGVLRRCAWCGELRDRLALPDDGERACRGCVSYAAKRARWYGEDWALPAGLTIAPATEAAPVVGAEVRGTSHRRRAA